MHMQTPFLWRKKCIFCKKENGSNDLDTMPLLAAMAYFNVECMSTSIYEEISTKSTFLCRKWCFCAWAKFDCIENAFLLSACSRSDFERRSFPIQYRKSWTIDSAIVCSLSVYGCRKIDCPRWNRCVFLFVFSKLSFENTSQRKKVFAMLRKRKLGVLRKKYVL